MFCNQCGCELPDNSRFCLKCGARLPELGTRPAPAQQPQAQPAPVGSAPEPLCLTLQAYVDEAQIREEELVELSDPRLPCPARIQLRRNMKEGDVLTVTSERSAASFAPFRLVLHVAAESFELHRTVTEDQLRRGEILEVQDPRLARPARVQLDPEMREGDRKLIRPSAGKSDFSPFWLVIHVAPQQTRSARQPDPAQHTSQPLIDVTVRAEQIRKHETITVRDCRLPRAVEVVLRDDMGNGDLIRITPGKGKLFFVLRPEMVLRGEKRLDKSGRPEQFIFYLQDGRGLRLNLTGNKAVSPAIAQVFRA